MHRVVDLRDGRIVPLQVNAFGFPALLAQTVVFFLASGWLVINHVNTRACDCPLLRTKYVLLLQLLPFLLVAALRYHRRPLAGCLVTLLSAIAFVVTMVATLFFLSLYV